MVTHSFVRRGSIATSHTSSGGRGDVDARCDDGHGPGPRYPLSRRRAQLLVGLPLAQRPLDRGGPAGVGATPSRPGAAVAGQQVAVQRRHQRPDEPGSSPAIGGGDGRGEAVERSAAADGGGAPTRRPSRMRSINSRVGHHVRPRDVQRQDRRRVRARSPPRRAALDRRRAASIGRVRWSRQAGSGMDGQRAPRGARGSGTTATRAPTTIEARIATASAGRVQQRLLDGQAAATDARDSGVSGGTSPPRYTTRRDPARRAASTKRSRGGRLAGRERATSPRSIEWMRKYADVDPRRAPRRAPHR